MFVVVLIAVWSTARNNFTIIYQIAAEVESLHEIFGLP